LKIILKKQYFGMGMQADFSKCNLVRQTNKKLGLMMKENG
jgi:hypothetical protein